MRLRVRQCDELGQPLHERRRGEAINLAEGCMQAEGADDVRGALDLVGLQAMGTVWPQSTAHRAAQERQDGARRVAADQGRRRRLALRRQGKQPQHLSRVVTMRGDGCEVCLSCWCGRELVEDRHGVCQHGSADDALVHPLQPAQIV